MGKDKRKKKIIEPQRLQRTRRKSFSAFVSNIDQIAEKHGRFSAV
jgi:hypothetical protein